MQPIPPETKHEVSATELFAAISGRKFQAYSWFRKVTKQELFRDDDLLGYIGGLDDNEDMEYIALKEVKCELPTYESLFLHKISESTPKLGLIFYKSVLPGILVKETRMHDWLLINTHIRSLTIALNSRIGNLHIRENSQMGSVFISGASVTQGITIEDNSQVSNIYVYSKSQCGDLDISGNSQTESLNFEEDSQIGNILIKQNSKCAGIHIRGSKVETIQVKENSEALSIGILGGSQCEGVIVEKGQVGPLVIGDTKISHIHFNEGKALDVGITEGVQCESLLILGSSLVGSVQIRGAYVKEAFIENNHCNLHLLNATVPIMRVHKCHIQELKWQAGTKAELYITDTPINYLNLSNTALSKESVLSITDCAIHIVRLQGLTVLGLLIIRNVSALKELFLLQPGTRQANPEFYHDIDQGVYEEHDADVERLKTTFKERPLFLIVNSSLGRTEITGCDLEPFRLEYRDSRLLEVFLSGTKLPSTNIYCPSGTLPPREEYEQKAAIYNQLKRVFDNQGDIVEATQYHARAMESQKKLLQLAYREKYHPKWYSVNKWFTDEGFDLFNFRLNRLSNNHGESWRRALGFIFCVSFFFYTCYYISLNYHKQFALTWRNVDDFVGNYFAFFDLTHKIDFMVGKSALNAVAIFLDFLGRIAIGYSVYQLISAFRRHGRK